MLAAILSGSLLVACGGSDEATCEAVRNKLSSCVFSAEQSYMLQQLPCEALLTEYDEQTADCSQPLGKGDGIDWTEHFASWFHEKTGWCSFDVCKERQYGWCVRSEMVNFCPDAYVGTASEG